MARIARYMVCSLLLIVVLIMSAACAKQTTVTPTPKATHGAGSPVPALPQKPGAGSTNSHKNPSQSSVTPAVPLPTPDNTSPMAPAPTPPPANNGSGGSSGSPQSAAAQAVFALINQERASQGKPALTWNTGLVQSAHTHNLTMAAANKLSHQLPGEPDFGTRERNAGVNWMSAAENIGWSSGGDAQTQAVNMNKSMFAEQPPDDGHRVNILSANTNIGIDVYVDSKGQVWLTEDFAAF